MIFLGKAYHIRNERAMNWTELELKCVLGTPKKDVNRNKALLLMSQGLQRHFQMG